MGLLRVLIARSISHGRYSNSETGSVEYSEQLDSLDHEISQSYLERQREESDRLAKQALKELLERDSSTPGRKPYLPSYDEYKRQFLKRWAVAIAQAAREDGVTRQEDLAALLGFGGARQWRVVMSGETGACGASRRVTDAHFRVASAVIAKRRWQCRGSLNRAWLLRLMSPGEFERWAVDIALRRGATSALA